MAAFLWLSGAGFFVEGQDTDASGENGAPTDNSAATLPSTNAAASAILNSHPGLMQSVPPSTNQGFSLRPPSPPPEIDSETEPKPNLSVPILSQLGQADDLKQHLLVVYNENDPDSKDLATYYAGRREIAPDHILSIACPTTEEISRAQYNETIREPIMAYMRQKDWIARQSQQVRIGNRIMELLVTTRNDIWAIVLMRGVPLKIAPDSDNQDSMQSTPEMATNAAAVDNELALLPVFGLPIGGCVPNLFYDSSGLGLQRVGPESATKLVLVTRLDGPHPDDVRRMIDDTLYAEENRLAGLAVIDSRGIHDVKNNYILGDGWLRQSRDLLIKDGWAVKFDDREDVIPATDPCDQVALYFGWYRADAVGPWVSSPDRFVRGAIAYHLHSFSASTVRSDTSNWVGPLISHGAAATMGMVYEPYLDGTPHIDIFTRRLLAGNFFAEAAYASEKALSWMLTVVGDPLYRPFREPLPAALAKAGAAHSDHGDWLLLQQVQQEIEAGKIPDQTAAVEQALDVPQAGAVVLEGLGDLLQKVKEPSSEAIVKAYRKAMSLDAMPIDRIRVELKLAHYFAAHGHQEEARAELKLVQELYPQDAPRFGVTEQLVSSSPSSPPTNLSSHPASVAPPAPPTAPSPPSPTIMDVPKPPGPPGPPMPH